MTLKNFFEGVFMTLLRVCTYEMLQNKLNIFKEFFSNGVLDGAFSIGTGLERVGVFGPIRRSCALRYL